ncbi:hypothetical protein AB0H76_24735 [Nocardia sp. NPDC050712]|uniref:hypothetical protein n=1 Tax=Nocardia sp. NPDC050712 TaxID=3155518 RepID=UPI0034112B19
MPTDKKTFRRRAARVIIAGALVTVPLGALAVTANAQAPTDDPVDFANTVTTEAPEGTEINDNRWRPAIPALPTPGDPSQTIVINPGGPGPGPDSVPARPHHPRGDHPEQGPTFHLQHRPATGSAGSS